jgi:hypothetical protein
METDFLREAFEKTGYKQNFTANKLDVKERTLYNWMSLQGLEHTVKFIQFLELCGICPLEFVNKYRDLHGIKCDKSAECELEKQK